MTEFAVDPQQLKEKVEATLGALAQSVHVALGEVTVHVGPANLVPSALLLRDAAGLQFEIALDLCGLDYSQYRAESTEPWEGRRFCAATHLLSISLNQRLRLKVFADDDGLPVLPTLTGVWNSLDWFEREAFDLYGIVFEGHNDLRRILTDYGFIGHPFRKDFPVTGHVEMRYDAEQKRVVYQPVSIEVRENVPRVIREDSYGGVR